MNIQKKKRNKVLVIGLDGATFDLIRPWIEKGELPALRKLIETGACGELTSTIPPVTAPAWTSFATGKNPGKHGVFDFRMREKNSYKMKPISMKDRDGEAIWNILSRWDRKVGILNLALTYPPEKVNGFMVSGFLAPENKNYSFPNIVLKELKEKIVGYRIHPKTPFSNENKDKYVSEVNEMTENLKEATLFLMEKYDWDFFLTVFQSTDWLQHYFFEDEKLLLEHYKKIDNSINSIIEKLDKNTTIIIMSDHGFGPLIKSVYINSWLEKNGLIKYKRNLKYLLFRLGLTPVSAYNLLRKLKLTKIYKMMSRETKNELIQAFFSFSDIDWAKTKAYSVGFIGQIFINLEGREPLGIVKPGDEYKETTKFIVTKLRELKDPDSGARVVDEVYLKEEIYSGKHLDGAPDIIFLTTKYMQSEIEFGSKSLVGPSPKSFSGHHRINGIVIINGPQIKKRAEILNSRIVDLVPTILYLMGIPIPNDIDGKILTDAITSEFLTENPIKWENNKLNLIHEKQRIAKVRKELERLKL